MRKSPLIPLKKCGNAGKKRRDAMFCVYFSKGVWGIFASEGLVNPAFHKKYIPNYKKNLHLNKIFVFCRCGINRIEKTKAKSAKG